MVKKPLHDLTVLESHPQWPLAMKICQELKKHGYESYLAGGCVRDLLLQKTPKDIDIATAATPEQVAPLFAKTVAVGVSFGVIRVVENEQMLEVASFRKDGNYGDGRHPESITYSSAEEDAQRRDFTINALFLDPVSMEVIDFVGGIEDLKKKCLQTVGLPENRFAEDHLRILRALRFSAQLDFKIETKTWEVLKSQVEKISRISTERIREELLKTLQLQQAYKGLSLWNEAGVLQVIWPEYEMKPEWKLLFAKAASGPEDALGKFFWPHLPSEKNWEKAEANIRKICPTRKELSRLRLLFNFLQESAWEKKRLGEKLLFFADPDGNWILKVASELNEKWQKQINLLSSQENWPQGKLPLAFLRGEDTERLENAQKGEALKEAYLLQLEGELENREAALNWLNGFQPKKSK